MAYNFTVPARTDINRAAEDVNVRITDVTIRMKLKNVTVIVQRTNRNTFDVAERVFTFFGAHFIEIAGAAPAGTTLYDSVRSELWNKLIQLYQREITFGEEPPLMPDGTVEPTPTWTEV